MLCRREISLFLHNNQTISHQSSIHSSRASHEILDSLIVHVDGRKENALYHSSDSIIQFQSQNYLFILSSSPDSEANAPSSPILSNYHLHNSIRPYANPARQKQHQKTNASPTVPFLFRYHHSQSDTFISTLKSHTTHSFVILNLTTPFPSTSIHQCILIKSIIHSPPPLRLQPITPSPHSIHSNHNPPLFVKFRSIHFTLHL